MTPPATWSDLGELFDGPHATPQRQAAGPYFLNISSLKGGRLDLSASDHISPEQFGAWTRRVTPRQGDLLFSYETRLGEAALMPPGIDACLGRRMALLRPDPEVVDSRYLLYYFLSPSFQKTLVKHTIHGATVPRILLSEMPTWPVSVHDMGEQRGIAAVLGALDDKIAVNAQLATTADDLVRSWFTAATLTAPSLTPVGALAEHPRVLTEPDAVDPGTTYVGLEHVPRRLMWLDDFSVAETVTSTKAAFEQGDVLFGKLRPYFHKVVSAPAAGICSTDIMVIRARESSLEGFVLAAVSSDRTVERCTAASEGTRMPRTSWKDLSAVMVPWPGEVSAAELSSRVVGLRGRIDSGYRESAKLAQMRDALLPRLMSGTIRVKDAERVVEGVV